MKKIKSRWNLIELQNFSQELAHLLAAGIPLVSALVLLQQWSEKKEEAALAESLQKKISRGESFSSAWRELTQENLSSALLLAGEVSGRLKEMLQSIFQYAKSASELRQIVWQALRYPLFLLGLTLGMLVLLCAWVIPQFSLLYGNFKVKIPPLTQAIMSVGAAFSDHSSIIFVSMMAFVFLALIFRRNSLVENFFSRLKRKFAWYRQAQELRFWQAISVLMCAGILFNQALEIAIQIETDPRMILGIQQMIRQLQRGEKPSAVLASLEIFSPKLVAIFGLAEVSGQLTELLSGYVQQQSEQLQYRVQSLKSWLEPIFLCVIGGVIGVVLIALYLPIIEFGRWV